MPNNGVSAVPESPRVEVGEGEYSFVPVTVDEAIERAVSGDWDVPEFQREFVWKPAQVCGLADSLWRNYPIGPLLLWNIRTDGDAGSPLWIADGQQRLTALCLLYGRVPSWFKRKPVELRARIQRRFDIRLDLAAGSGPRFVAANSSQSGPGDPRLVPIGRLSDLDPGSTTGTDGLERRIRDLKDAGHCRNLDEAELHARLLRAGMMRQRKVIATLVNHPRRDDVLDIFERLNSRGMRFRRLLLKLMMEEIPAALRGMRGHYEP
jgi:Protein of unknown function DUF262